jgi:peroxiredoxin
MLRLKPGYLTLGVLLLMFGAVVATYFGQFRPAAIQLGKPAPDFTVVGLSGARLTLSEYRGSPVIVNFFASWCRACRGELPDLKDTADRYRDRGLRLLGVAVRDSDDSVSHMVENLGLSFPVGLDPSGEVAVGRYRVQGLPMTVFVDRQGVVRKIWVGPIGGSSLDRLVAEIL